MEGFTTYYQGNIKPAKLEDDTTKDEIKLRKQKDILPAVPRIIVIGDIHGDWKVTKQLFLKFKLINSNGKWIAEPKNTHVVQVGDIVDRGGRPDTIGDECSEIKILDFLDEIHSQAQLYGGGVFCILGNHEIMNVLVISVTLEKKV